MIADGVAWLHAQRHANMTREVTFRRGAISIDLSATVLMGRKREGESGGAAGFVMESDSREYLVRAQDLVHSATQLVPQPGDTFEESVLLNGSDVVAVFKVLADGDEPCWRWSDTNHTVMRIKAKRQGDPV